MLIYHWCVWQEGVPEHMLVLGQNFGLTRLSIHILLSGPTTLEQLDISITGPRSIKIQYKPPGTYLNARRNTVWSAFLSRMGLGGQTQQQQETILGMIAASSRATGHTEALKKKVPSNSRSTLRSRTFHLTVISTFVVKAIGEMALMQPIQTREHKVLRLAFFVMIMSLCRTTTSIFGSST